MDALLVHLTEESGRRLLDDGILRLWGELVPPVRALVLAVQLEYGICLFNCNVITFPLELPKIAPNALKGRRAASRVAS